MALRISMIAMLLVSQAANAQADDVLPQDVLTQARESAVRIRSADYLFAFERYYVDFQWFRFQEEMARFDAVVSERYQSVDAYNGKRYQSYEPIIRTLSVSQQPLDEWGLIGPCRTPLEVCYEWLTIGTEDFHYNWQSFRDPAVWDRLQPEPEVIERSINGSECLGVDFVYPNGTITRVYFDTEHGYFPVRREWMQSRDDQPRLRTEVTELTEVVTDEGSIWFPVRVTHDAADYVVQLDWLHVNEPLDENIFTLPKADAETIYDHVNKEVVIPATGRRVRFPNRTPRK